MKVRSAALNFETEDSMGPVTVDANDTSAIVSMPEVDGATHYRAEVFNTDGSAWHVSPMVLAAAAVGGRVECEVTGLNPGTETYLAYGVAGDHNFQADDPGT